MCVTQQSSGQVFFSALVRRQVSGTDAGKRGTLVRSDLRLFTPPDPELNDAKQAKHACHSWSACPAYPARTPDSLAPEGQPGTSGWGPPSPPADTRRPEEPLPIKSSIPHTTHTHTHHPPPRPHHRSLHHHRLFPILPSDHPIPTIDPSIHPPSLSHSSFHPPSPLSTPSQQNHY